MVLTRRRLGLGDLRPDAAAVVINVDLKVGGLSVEGARRACGCMQSTR